MFDIQAGKIGPDHRHHRLDRGGAHILQPFGLRPIEQTAAILLRERGPDALQIFARVKTLGDFADCFAQSLSVAQIGRAGQDINLGAGVIDIIFARHLMAGESQQLGERVAKHRASPMADMHGAGRVGRNIFDVTS